jgi:HTH-type transcriptional regulator/antitoxin HipB
MSKVKTFNKHLEDKYGKIGTPKRDEFQAKSKAFMVGELLKETRKSMHLTQEELAEKTGTKKSYISKLENGKVDAQISTIYKLFEDGLNKKINIVLE